MEPPEKEEIGLPYFQNFEDASRVVDVGQTFFTSQGVFTRVPSETGQPLFEKVEEGGLIGFALSNPVYGPKIKISWALCSSLSEANEQQIEAIAKSLGISSDTQENLCPSIKKKLLVEFENDKKAPWYKDCINPSSFISLEDWEDYDSNIDFVKIYNFNLTKPQCFERGGLLQWLNGNVFANWIQNPEASAMDDMGYGGMPGRKRYYKLMARDYLTSQAYNKVRNSRFKNFVLIPKGKVRIGNLEGRFGIGQQHGQIPGENVYDLKSIEDYTGKHRPLRKKGEIRFLQIVLILNSCLALTANGEVYGWGRNQYGLLGDGTDIQRLSPEKIDLPEIKQISGMEVNTGAVTEDGDVYMWGLNFSGQVGDGTKEMRRVPIKIDIRDKIKTINCGANNTGAITEDGKLYIWGKNSYGQIGDGTYTSRLTPIKITTNLRFASISCGGEYTGAITVDGDLYMWGLNFYGQLGDGTRENASRPVKIDIDDKKVRQICCSVHSTGAVTEDGDVYTWGLNMYGQLGDGTKIDKISPQRINIPGKVVQLVLSGSVSGAVTEEGKIYLWGRTFKILNKNIPVPFNIDFFDEPIVYLAMEMLIFSVITESGKLYMVGSNEYGELGNGTTDSTYLFSQIEI